MRREMMRLAVALIGAITMATPCHAGSLTVVPSTSTGFWAGTHLDLVAERASSGRLRVRAGGTIAVRSRARVSLFAVGCTAGLDDVASWRWSPEHHPAGRQAVPGDPVFQQDGTRLVKQLRGRQQVTYSTTVSSIDYGAGDTPAWTDCVMLMLTREAKGGKDSASAFGGRASTLYATLTLEDGRHVECGPAPAFCYQRRPDEGIPPALPTAPCPGCGPPAFPPAPGYPGSPGFGDLGPTSSAAYHVCGTPATGGPYLCDGKDPAALTPRYVP